MPEIETLSPRKPTSPFYYQIVEVKQGEEARFMPQRGVVAEGDVSMWFDGVPEPAPSLEMAKAWLKSMSRFDAKCASGRVVWVLGISPE